MSLPNQLQIFLISFLLNFKPVSEAFNVLHCQWSFLNRVFQGFFDFIQAEINLTIIKLKKILYMNSLSNEINKNFLQSKFLF